MAEGERRCGYVIVKRGRTCRMLAAEGSTFCCEHLIHHPSADGASRKRITCPLDPSHTVYEDVLHKHLKKCNVSKRVTPSCYSANINKGVASKEAPPTHPALTDYPAQQIEGVIRKVEMAYQGHVTDVKDEFLSHPCMSADLLDPGNGVSALKHLRQQSSLLVHLERRGLLGVGGGATCYLEFGAGRGRLTECIHRAIKYSPGSVNAESADLHYILVDRASCRRKVDGVHMAATKLAGATCHRLLMDIVDLDLSLVEAVKGCGLVGVGKHLCGAATDLALRCLVSTLHKEGAGFGGVKVCGLAIALCCHHRCKWEELAGQEYMTQLGVTAEDFHLMSHMTSWAVCGQRPPPQQERKDDGEGRRWGYVPHPNEGVGLKCKRLIDLARVHYLEQNGLRVELVHYVERSTSLENVLLIATRQQDS